MGEVKDPVVKVMAPLEDGDVIVDAFGTRFIIRKESLFFSRHPVDVLKDLYPELGQNTENEMRTICDEEVRIDNSKNEIICPFCQTPQRSICVYGKMRTICKSCDKEFEVERRI